MAQMGYPQMAAKRQLTIAGGLQVRTRANLPHVKHARRFVNDSGIA
jgi:hypothetical protein